MKRHAVLCAVAIAGWLTMPVLAAQENRAAAGSSAAGTGVAATGGGGGSHASGGGGSSSGGSSSGGGGSSSAGSSSGGGSGASGFSSAGGNGGRVDVGGRHATTGGSGIAISRGGDRGSSANGSARGDRGRDGYANAGSGGGKTTGTRIATDSGSTTGAGGTAVGRTGGTREPRTQDGTPSEPGGSPAHARPRDGDEPIIGTAVPRGSVPPATGGGNGGVIIGGGYPFYPWWAGGVGYYGGYYGGYYDPWFGGYPDPGYYPQGGSYSDEGSLRLKIKPREAEVYVDGYFVGIVDQFDGTFQRLHIETGPHRIEVRSPGYETLTFDVRITPDHSTTYQGELKKIQ